MSLRTWTTRDILITAVLGIVLGLLATVVDYAYTTAGAALGPIASRTLIGIMLFTALFIPFVVRRPLAALIGMLIIGLVQIPFSPNGIFSLVVALMYGILVEVAFAITRYRRYDLLMLVVTAIVIGLIMVGISYVPNGLHQLAIGVQIGILVGVAAVSALGGWLVPMAANALAQAGALSGTALDASVD
ncbi:MAG: ECF transporter S component [Chloroflexota bacterium]